MPGSSIPYITVSYRLFQFLVHFGLVLRSFGRRWFCLLSEGGDGRRDGVDGGMGLYLLLEIRLVVKYEHLTPSHLGVIQHLVIDFFRKKTILDTVRV